MVKFTTKGDVSSEVMDRARQELANVFKVHHPAMLKLNEMVFILKVLACLNGRGCTVETLKERAANFLEEHHGIFRPTDEHLLQAMKVLVMSDLEETINTKGGIHA